MAASGMAQPEPPPSKNDKCPRGTNNPRFQTGRGPRTRIGFSKGDKTQKNEIMCGMLGRGQIKEEAEDRKHNSTFQK